MTSGFYPQNLSEATPDQLREAFGVSDFFVYPANFASLAPGSVATYTLNIESSSDFLWQDATYQADIGATAFTVGTQPVPNVLFNVQDTSSGRYLMAQAVPLATMFGLGREPYTLKNPRWFRANTSVLITVTNYDAADTYNLYLSFIGTKFFDYPG